MSLTLKQGFRGGSHEHKVVTIHLKAARPDKYVRVKKKKRRKKGKRKDLKFSHIHPLVPELAAGLGPSLECSRVVEMLENRRQEAKELFSVQNV